METTTTTHRPPQTQELTRVIGQRVFIHEHVKDVKDESDVLETLKLCYLDDFIEYAEKFSDEKQHTIVMHFDHYENFIELVDALRREYHYNHCREAITSDQYIVDSGIVETVFTIDHTIDL